jgi:hypothetical protein
MVWCSYHITTIKDNGGATVEVSFYIDQGEMTEETSLGWGTANDWRPNITSIRYTPDRILQPTIGAVLPRGEYIDLMNKYLRDNFVTADRQPIPEQRVT